MSSCGSLSSETSRLRQADRPQPTKRPVDQFPFGGATNQATEKGESMDMTLSEAAEFLDIPQKRLYRAVKSGKLNANKRHQGSRWEYLVARVDLEEFAQETVRPDDQDIDSDRPTQRPVDQAATDQATDRPVGERPTNQPAENPPVELYLALVDRLQRAERRTVELELTLRQSQRLLTENAESITEKDALVQETRAQVEAIEKARQAEIERLAAESERLSSELEIARQNLEEAQKPKGFFSWLGLRSKRTAVSVEKAV